MGQRAAGESIAAIVQAFLKRRTWSQADLSRHVDVGVPALRKRLLELRSGGMPLTDERDPPHVYWSVPKTWFPGGVALGGKDVEILLRLLGRMSKSRERERLVRVALECLPGKPLLPSAVVPPELSGTEDRFFGLLEEAAEQRRAVRFRYYSASRGSDSVRLASVHRLLVGPPARFVATCHHAGTLKWFRVDNVFDASIDGTVDFRSAAPEAVDELVASSLDGYHDASARKERHTFFVRAPEARWVAKNLLEGMRVEPDSGGIRVAAETTALARLARYVVGLGEAARAETPALRTEVLRLARGAARTNAD